MNFLLLGFLKSEVTRCKTLHNTYDDITFFAQLFCSWIFDMLCYTKIPGSTLILLDYGVYSRDNLPNKVKDGAYAINPDEYFEVATHWIALYSLNNNVTYFDKFGVEHIPKEIRKFIDNESIINIFRIQPYDSVMS